MKDISYDTGRNLDRDRDWEQNGLYNIVWKLSHYTLTWNLKPIVSHCFVPGIGPLPAPVPLSVNIPLVQKDFFAG